VPGLTHRASSTHRCPASTQKAMKRASQQPPSKRRGMSARPTASKLHTVSLTSSRRTSQAARRPQPKRRHCERTKQENERDTEETDQRPAKQDRCQPDDQPKAPWKRWRQLEPRRERRIGRKWSNTTPSTYAKQIFPRERSEMSDNHARVSMQCIVERSVEDAKRRERWRESS
jgi:hypothetical protein